MNKHMTTAAATGLIKSDPTAPALIITENDGLAVKAGTVFRGREFDVDTPLPRATLEPGADYIVAMTESGDLEILPLSTNGIAECVLGGFHFAPGGNAITRSGGDSIPQINPYSIWDRNFRPACPNPRGMALVETTLGRQFWADIYLLGTDHHTAGTSRHGVKIADGYDRPVDPETGKRAERLDYDTATRVMAHHSKQLLSLEEFFAAAYGVTEKSACAKEPDVTGLDAPRTSKFGIMQATGNMWVWGHDGDPDEPRASFFGGSWLYGGYAGSRYAGLGRWPDLSYGDLGARGRSDHLQLA